MTASDGTPAAHAPGRNPRTRAGLAGFGRVLVIRLAPGEDVLPATARLLDDAGIASAVILSGVASLRHASVRNITRFPPDWPVRPGDRTHMRVPGPLEVLAMQGNVAPAPDGSRIIHCHADFSVGAPPAVTYGGHLMEDTVVGTTCELYVAELTGADVRRVHDEETRTFELDVTPALPPGRAGREE